MKNKKLSNDCFVLPRGNYWTPVASALDHLRNTLSSIASVERIAVCNGHKRILAEPLFARQSSPPFSNSAVDGYGFALSEITGKNKIPILPGRSAAGEPFDRVVPKGSAIKILTGAVLPSGVDTVILNEDVRIVDGCLEIDASLNYGTNTRLAGEDIKEKDLLLPVGHILRSQDLAFITSAGINQIEVFSPLRIGVLSTGNELLYNSAKENRSLQRGQIYDSNRPMLISLLKHWGQVVVDLGILPDRIDTIRDGFNSLEKKTDVIITSGGVSSGDEDHVSNLIQSEGRLDNWRIAVKPGRPLALGFWKETPVFGLPGNPVAAFVCSLIFLRPALGLLAGGKWHTPESFKLPSAFQKKKKKGRREFLRGKLNKDGFLSCFPSEGSGRISSLSWSTGLIELDDDIELIKKGDRLNYIPYASFDF